MSGHSKWSTIKHKKGKTDAQRAKVFTKIGREIIVAVKEGGPDPSTNNKLREVIAKAKSNNVPNDNINRVIKKAAGDTDKNNFEEIVYEGYGPGGVAVIVEALTDNRNRTAADLRHNFDKFGGNMGTPGCVSFMFAKKGLILVDKELHDEDELMEMAIDLGAEDFVADEMYEIYTTPGDFLTVSEGLSEKSVTFLSSEVRYIPDTYVKLDEGNSAKMEKLIDMLEENDDVQNIWHNIEE